MVVRRRRGTARMVLGGLCLGSVALVGNALISQDSGSVVLALEPTAQVAHAPRSAGSLAVVETSEAARRDSLESRFADLRTRASRSRDSARNQKGPNWIAHAIADLADDDVRWNAGRAIHELSQGGEEVVEPLRAALDSSDHQQRQLAGLILQRLDVDPDERLIEVSLEALRCDGLPYGDHFTPAADNEGSSARYLLKHFDLVRTRLGSRLYSDDGMERFLSAYLLVSGGDRSALARCCAILVDHLQDNDIRHDARLAAEALHSLGEDALPYLAFAFPVADEQATELLSLLERDVHTPARTADERWERTKSHPRAANIHRGGRRSSGPHLATTFAGPDQWNSPRTSIRRLRALAGHSGSCTY